MALHSLGLAFILLLAPVADESSAASNRHLYPLAKPIAAPRFIIDVSDAPEAKEWAETSKRLCEEWFPVLCTLVATESYKAPEEVRLVFKKEQGPPAFASGNMISVNGKWITEHPDDFGMMIHELTHIIQSYPRNRNNTGWLVEGIADYIRWWRYEPEAPRPRIDAERHKHTDGYRTTGAFLAWASRKYHMSLVPELDRCLRKGEDPGPVFVRITGKGVEDLWKEFVTP